MLRLPGGVVWLASYPKSGNTWMRLLLANIQSEDGLPVCINQLEPGSFVHSRRLFDLNTLVDSALLRPDEFATLRSSVIDEHVCEQRAPIFAKVHDAWIHGAGGLAMLRRRERASLYRVRDPADGARALSSRSRDALR